MFTEKDLRIEVLPTGVMNEGTAQIRVTHVPTGLSTQCGSEKSQMLNKAAAIRELERAYRILSQPVGGSMSSLEVTDAASEAVRKGFRVTLDDLKARVVDVEYIRRYPLTVAVVKLDNGWYLVGKSAPVDSSNFSWRLGCDLAYEDALRQAWPLLAFAHLESS